MMVIAIGVDSYKALIVSQVMLSIQLPFTIIPLLWLSRSRRVMGDAPHGTGRRRSWACCWRASSSD